MVVDGSIFRSLSLEAIDELAIDALFVDESAVAEIFVEELAAKEPFSKSVVEEAAADKAAGTFFAKFDEFILGDHKTALTSHKKNLCQTIRIRISSKHFILVSPVFRIMFKIKDWENLNLNSQGYGELSLLHDNSAAIFYYTVPYPWPDQKGASQN